MDILPQHLQQALEVANLMGNLRTKVYPLYMNQFNNDERDFLSNIKELKALCEKSESGLLVLQCKVRENKCSDDNKEVALSSTSSAAGVVTMISLFIPITWPVAVASATVAAASAIGGVVKNQQSVMWQSEVQKEVQMLQVRVQEMVDKLSPLMEKIVNKFLALANELQDGDIASKMGAHTDSYQISQNVKYIADQFVKFGCGTFPLITAVTNASILPESLRKETMRCTQKVCNQVFKSESVQVQANILKINGTEALARKTQQTVSTRAIRMAKQSKSLAVKETEKHCTKVVQKASALGPVLRVAGAGLAVYSLGSDLYNLSSTLDHMNDEHELHKVIGKIIEELRKEKKRIETILSKVGSC